MNIFHIILMIGILLLLAGIAIYIYRFVKRVAKNLNIKIKSRGAKFAVIAVSILLFWCTMNIFSVSSIILLHFVIISMLVDVINIMTMKLSNRKENKSIDDGGKSESKRCEVGLAMKIWIKLYKTCIIPLALTICLISYGYINMMDIQETDYTVWTDKAIREEGYRVGLIADLHFGISIDIEELAEVCEDISEEDIDIMVLCGDLVDERTSYEEMKAVFSTLGNIKSTYGIYYVYGNHDRQHYSSNGTYTEEQLVDAITSNGITILQDEVTTINGELTIIGREDASDQRKTLDELYEGVDKNDYVLVVDHQPSQYSENVKLGTDLALSGHTHAGQIWPANILLSIVKFNDAVYGETTIDSFTGIVTSGIAGWGYPIKTSSPAEYVIVDIKR